METLLTAVRWFTINVKLSSALALPLLLLWLVVVMLLWERRKARKMIERMISLAAHASISTYRSSLPQLCNELARARRTQRPLSLAVLRLGGDLQPGKTNGSHAAGNGNGTWGMQQMQTLALVFPQFGYILRNALRESDIVACGPAPNEYLVALAETNKEQALHFVRRFSKLALVSPLIEVKAGIAEFPSDGLTIEDLATCAQKTCQELAEPLPYPPQPVPRPDALPERKVV
jgi:GGDEF domain-containing protein